MQMKVILSVLALFSIAFLVPSDAFGAWYDDNWENRKKITISLNTEISNNLNNFPVLVAVTDSDFTKSSDSGGRDIFFTADDGTTLLSYEIERFNSSTGEIIAWVNIPALLAASTTDIYIYYNGPTQSTPSNMWDSNYKLVYHLNQTSTGTLNEFVDASDTGNDGTGGGEGTKTNDTDRIPTRVEGKIGYGQSFDGPTQPGFRSDGSGDFIFIDNVNNWPGNSGSTSDNDTTVEFWAKVESGQSNIDKMDFFGYSASGNDNEFVLFKIDSLNAGVRSNAFDSDVDAATSDWTHLMIVFNPGGIYKIYQDGALAEESSGTIGNKGQRASGDFALGAEIDSSTLVNNELQGDLDEFRISNTIRSDDWAAATYATQNNPSVYLSFGTEEPELLNEEKNDSECYDCEAPKLAKVEVHITSNTSDEIINENAPQISETRDYVWIFDQKSPYPIFDDYKTPIVADPGDEVEIILELTDNRSLEKISDSGTYTNFLHKPNDMNQFYANNFDEYGKVSTTFYEWHQTGDDLFYDYGQTVEWNEADVTIQESGEFLTGGPVENLDHLVGTFTISFKMKFLEPMQSTDVWIQTTDFNGNFFKVALPLTLEVSGYEPRVFEYKVQQKVLGYYDEQIFSELISDWDGSYQNISELESFLNIPAESLPKWVTFLGKLVTEDKISSGEMIVAVEHLLEY
jgi:hypothetical protein